MYSIVKDNAIYFLGIQGALNVPTACHWHTLPRGAHTGLCIM